MQYYSTNHQAPIASLHKAVVKGLAEDRGLYMPEHITPLPQEFFQSIDNKSFQEIAFTVAEAFFGEDVKRDDLQTIVYDTLQFDCPVKKVEDDIYSLELFPHIGFQGCRRTLHGTPASVFHSSGRAPRPGERAGGNERRHGVGCG